MIYGAVVLMVICLTVLSLQQLLDAGQYKYRFSAYYLHLCLVRYNGDISTAAAAYHSGWGTVDALLQKEEHSEDGLTLSGFPYNQMHHYVEKITACYAKYTELYGA